MKMSGRMTTSGNHSSKGSSKGTISAVRKVAAPKPPANASMKGMGNKLRKGN